MNKGNKEYEKALNSVGGIAGLEVMMQSLKGELGNLGTHYKEAESLREIIKKKAFPASQKVIDVNGVSCFLQLFDDCVTIKFPTEEGVVETYNNINKINTTESRFDIFKRLFKK